MGADANVEAALASGGAVLDSLLDVAEPGADVEGEIAPPPLPPPKASPPAEPLALVSGAVAVASASVVAPVAASSIVPCAKPSKLGGTDRFAAWTRGMSQEELEDISSSFAKWKAAELAWLKSLGKKKPLLFERKHEHRTVKLATRLAKGCEYSQWLEGPGAKSKAPLRDFLQQTRAELQKFVPKKERQYLLRCLKAWREHCSETDGLGACLPRARKGPHSQDRLPYSARIRGRGMQGRGYHCPELRELLWDWFVDVRASIATIMTPKNPHEQGKGAGRDDFAFPATDGMLCAFA